MCENDITSTSFTFVWKLKNASYSLREDNKVIESPEFTVDELLKAKFRLVLDFSSSKIRVFLQRKDNISLNGIYVDVEFAFLSSEGKVLKLDDGSFSLHTEDDAFIGTNSFASVNEVFYEKRALFLPDDTLTIRCRMWNFYDEFLKHVHYIALTRIGVEKRLFLWSIENFDSFSWSSKQKYEVKSLDNSKKFMSLELFLADGTCYDKKVCFKTTFYRQNVKNFTLRVFIVDAFNNTVKCFDDEIFARDHGFNREFTLSYTKDKLIEKKSVYLPHGTLTLLFKFVFSFGIIVEEIEIGNCDAKRDQKDFSLLKGNELAIHKSILAEDLNTMLSSSCLSDVKLQTKTQAYPAHKCILGARSPVFQAMFESDMREKINNVVNVDDLNDDTVTRLLNYIYKAEIGKLEWGIATELYEAADKYQILNLKNICASYLKANLGVNSSCELLILADLHQDEDLKRFVQDFILQHGTEIINSKEWDQLMENNLKLAAETMRLKFKK